MQKTFEFGVSIGKEYDDKLSSADSLCPKSSDVVGDSITDTQSSAETPEVSATCLEACCKPVPSEPNQLRSHDILDATTKTVNGQKRSVSASWFDCYTWLTFCETRNVLLCHYCVEVDHRRLLTFSTKGDDAFMRNGFSRWKNALECFAKHEATGTHKEAVMKLSSVAKVNVCAMLDARMKEQQLQRQRMLQTLLCVLPCPARASISWS